jgi:FAD/FMN-containing dehydrogenase
MAYLASVLGKSVVDVLKRNVTGDVILPSDSNYDSARAAWNLTVDQYPDVILVAANAQDVAAGLQFAQRANLGVAVLSTGHGVALPANHALLIVTSQMTDVLVDTETQTARIQAGVRWHMVLEKAHEVGLAPLLGSSSGVGAVGYTLGGGMGWLARKYGLSADSVLEFQVVTADGSIVYANENQNSDLYWALRGGGGSFGVVVALTIKLYPVAAIYGGSLIYPAEMAKEVFIFYRDWIKWLPNEWTTSISVMNFPPLPDLPPFMSGKSVVMVNGAYCGDVQVGAMMLQAWLDWKEPLANSFHPMPFNQIDAVSNDPKNPSSGKSSGGWLKDLSDETIDAIVQNAVGSPILKFDVRYAGGAIANTHNNAFSHRDAAHLFQMVTIVPTPEVLPQIEALIADFKQKLAPHLTGAIYMNFVEGREQREQTSNGFTPEKFARLQEVKAKYDPDNIFRFGFNILPKK